MSYESWHTYGYGVQISAIGNIAMSKVVEQVQSAPKYAEGFNKWLQNRKDKELTLEDLEEFDDDYGIGLATILAKVIRECEGVELTACNDLDDETYLLYAETYPWCIPENQKSLKEEDIQSLMVKYLSKLTDEAITVDYYGAENGG